MTEDELKRLAAAANQMRQQQPPPADYWEGATVDQEVERSAPPTSQATTASKQVASSDLYYRPQPQSGGIMRSRLLLFGCIFGGLVVISGIVGAISASNSKKKPEPASQQLAQPQPTPSTSPAIPATTDKPQRFLYQTPEAVKPASAPDVGSRDRLTPDQSFPLQIMKCNGDISDANLRDAPSGSLIGVLPNTAVFRVVGQEGDWFKIETPIPGGVKAGYVNRCFIEGAKQ